MKEEYYLLQTYEIFLKLIYLKLLQENLNNEIIGFTDKTGEEESVYYTVTDIQRSEDGSCFISEDPARDGANWYGYAGQNPMVYVDRIGLFFYTGNVQQSSNNTNQAGTESAEKKNSEAPNITGGGPTEEQTPPVPNIEADGGNKVSKRKKAIIEQLKYLKEITDKEYTTPQEKANAAKILREEIRDKKKYNINALFGLDEPFMNTVLRDFFNTSDTGLDYVYSDMKIENGWELTDSAGAREHQRTSGDFENQKWVNKKDGREAIFKTDDGEIYTLVKGGSIEAEMDKGTYNYAKNTSRICDWITFSEHGRWDMDTYFRQWNYTPPYRIFLGHDFSSPGYNSHYEYMYKVE